MKFLSLPFALSILPVLGVGCSRSAPTDRIIMVDDDDAEMNAAIAAARATLPQFWQAFEQRANGERQFCLKVEISDAGGDEHFWVREIEKKDGKVFGTIDNEPNIVKSVKVGQRIEVSSDKISDWLFLREGKMVGNYTVRPLMKSMSADELAEIKGMLAEP
jgi:uncharacterized protein YegJ (DUF2314 family)